MSKSLQPPRTQLNEPVVLVAGDVVVDHHIYEGERVNAASYGQRGVKVVRQHGGAYSLYKLIHSLLLLGEEDEDTHLQWKAMFALDLPELSSEPSAHHALATWRPFPREVSSKDKVWRASLLMGYGHEAANDIAHEYPTYTPRPIVEPQGRILVLDDAGFLFRNKALEKCWMLPEQGKPQPEWIALKMTGALCHGDLWHRLAEAGGDRLICVVSANDLRSENVNLSRGLSWEQTVEDTYRALDESPLLGSLLTIPRHLVITYSADGALWIDNSDRKEPRATLVFDAGRAEGEWAESSQGEAFGYLGCLTASIACSLISAEPARGLSKAIAAGLGAMRNLRAQGHGEVSAIFPDGFPHTRLAQVINKGSGAFSFARVPWTESERMRYRFGAPSHSWRILESSQSPFPDGIRSSLEGLARQVVLQGVAALRRLPHASFGALLTADRLEIESLRVIRRAMLDYRDTPRAKKPLSIGVFGPPGAGKSFGVRQLANGVFGERAWLEFNLSQFTGTNDLIGAFHQVRDLVLSGITPVAFWDEFDAREYEWLQYLLAPMQDGRFQEGQLTHAIGKCVFIFAGGTSYTYEEFGPQSDDRDAWRSFKLRKGPDFHSRLDAFYNVLGPNQRTREDSGGQRTVDEGDVCAPLRRALLIRALLDVPRDARIDFDSDLLDALLRVPGYRHGARSLEKIVVALRPAAGKPVRRSSLPSPSQIEMNVVTQPNHDFDSLLRSNNGFRMSQAISSIAEAIHENWRLSAAEGNRLNRAWSDLSELEKQDSIEAARRIPQVLALAGLTVAQASDQSEKKGMKDDDAVARQIEHHLERLAEAEHDGWVDQRMKNGWTFGAVRNDLEKRHPLLIPYADLPESEKDKDRRAVLAYLDTLMSAGYRVSFHGS